MNDSEHVAAPDFPCPTVAYADAPSIVAEIRWLAERAAHRPFGHETSREFWLRKSALLDRIALAREVTHTPEDAADAANVATNAALMLIEYDEVHGSSHGRSGAGSLRFWDPVIGAGRRAYVRREYVAWNRAQRF